MLQFKQDDTAAVMILTLTEFATIATPNYLFVFTHVQTKDVTKFVKTDAEDESNYSWRYNQFTINAATIFLDKPVGEWHYAVYEQASTTNTDISLAGTMLENGKLFLDKATDFEFTKYDEPTTYKVYNG